MVTYLEALYEVIRMAGSQRGRPPDGQSQTAPVLALSMLQLRKA